MFTYKNAVKANPQSKTAVTIAVNLHGDIACVDSIPEQGIVMSVMNKQGQITEAYEYASMHHVFLDCIPLMYLEGWNIQHSAWTELFGTYLEEDELPEPMFMVLGDM